MNPKPRKFQRGDAVRIVVSGRLVLASIVAEIAGESVRFRLYSECGKVYERGTDAMRHGDPGDREKLTTALANLHKSAD